MKFTKHQTEALDISRHITLSANAGSGKTAVLCERFINIALQDNVNIDEIVAITFTEKAASELYNKISAKIIEKIQEYQLTNEIETINRLEKLRNNLIFAHISTIHSFCIELLNNYPIEANLDTDFLPIDASSSNDLIDKSVDEVLQNYFDNNEPDEAIKNLIRVFDSSFKLKECIRKLINKRSVYQELREKYSPDNLNNLIDELKNYTINLFKEVIDGFEQLQPLIKKLNDNVLNAKDLKNRKYAEQISFCLGAYTKETDTLKKANLILAIKESIISNSKLRTMSYKKYTNCTDIEKSQIELFFTRFDYSCSVDEELLIKQYAKTAVSIFTLLEECIARYDKYKTQNNYLDFDDILLKTHNLLGIDLVLSELQSRFRYIMIDEYQDTDNFQYELFKPILKDLQQGNLFVVGDEKQSIYAFRNADIKVFQKTKKDVISSSGLNLMLPDNFRMVPEICFLVNTIFGQLFENPDERFNEVGNSNLIYGRNDDVKGEIEFLISDANGNTDNKESIEENGQEESEEKRIDGEASLIAKRIKQLYNENSYLLKDKDEEKVKFSSIAVLCLKRKYYANLESEFSKNKIPYTIINGKGFFQTQLVRDVKNYLNFLLDQNDEPALISILRSPFFMFSDVDIYNIYLTEGRSFWQKLETASKENEKYKFTYDTISANIPLILCYDIAALLRKIYTENNYLNILSAKVDGKQEIYNSEKLIHIAMEFVNEGFRNLYDFTKFLDESINKDTDESQADISVDANTVKVMTIHQAKGLEWSAVFIYNTNDLPQLTDFKAKDVSIDKEYGLITKVPLENKFHEDYQPTAYCTESYKSIIKKELADKKRVLYVAMTRAKNYLGLGVTFNEKHAVKKNSFFEFISRVIPENIEFVKGEYEKLLSEGENDHIQINLHLKKIYEIEDEELKLNEIEYNEQPKVNLAYKIEEVEEEEIISGSRYNLFKQCPRKYYFSFELGYNDIYPLAGQKNLEDKELKADDFNDLMKDRTLKGTIVHKILQRDIDKNDLQTEIKNIVKSSIEIQTYSNSEIDKYCDNINKQILGYYDSKNYAEIVKFEKYFNEYEVLSQLSNFYVYGVIDKIIFDKNKIIIVDYKSDEFAENYYNEKKNDYINQLKFYSYIVSKIFPEYSVFELRLVFLSYPDKIEPVIIEKSDFTIFESELLKSVNQIRNKEFYKNRTHCNKCIFSVNKIDCIMN